MGSSIKYLYCKIRSSFFSNSRNFSMYFRLYQNKLVMYNHISKSCRVWSRVLIFKYEGFCRHYWRQKESPMKSALFGNRKTQMVKLDSSQELLVFCKRSCLHYKNLDTCLFKVIFSSPLYLILNLTHVCSPKLFEPDRQRWCLKQFVIFFSIKLKFAQQNTKNTTQILLCGKKRSVWSRGRISDLNKGTLSNLWRGSITYVSPKSITLLVTSSP